MRTSNLVACVLALLVLASACGDGAPPTESAAATPSTTSIISTTSTTTTTTTSTTTTTLAPTYPEVRPETEAEERSWGLPPFGAEVALSWRGIPVTHRPAVFAAYADDRLCGAIFGEGHGTLSTWTEQTYDCIRHGEEHALIVEFLIGDNIDDQPAGAATIVTRFAPDGEVVQLLADHEIARDTIPNNWRRRTCVYDESAVEWAWDLPYSACGEWEPIELSIRPADLRIRPGESATLDTSGFDLPAGTPLFAVQYYFDRPSWHHVGEVGSDTITIPEHMAWRATADDSGVAVPETFAAGRYELIAWPGGEALAQIDILHDSLFAPLAEVGEFKAAQTRVADEPDLAILRADGLADVDFGTPSDEALPALIERFGSLLEDGTAEHCIGDLRTVRWANGIHATFDEVRGGGLTSYVFFADDVDLAGHLVGPPATPRPAFTTPRGLGLGDGVDEIWLIVDFLLSGYLGEWGSRTWTVDEGLGGSLDADVTAGGVIDSISAGAERPYPFEYRGC